MTDDEQVPAPEGKPQVGSGQAVGTSGAFARGEVGRIVPAAAVMSGVGAVGAVGNIVGNADATLEPVTLSATGTVGLPPERTELLRRLEAAERQLATIEREIGSLRVEVARGGLGHNQPPADLNAELEEARAELAGAMALTRDATRSARHQLLLPQLQQDVVELCATALTQAGRMFARFAARFARYLASKGDRVVNSIADEAGKIIANGLLLAAVTVLAAENPELAKSLLHLLGH